MKKIAFIFILFSQILFAQKVTTSLDSVKKKIGAEFMFTLKTTVDTSAQVQFPKSKNFGALEVIRSYKIDTIQKDDKYELIKKYGLTNFDSGRYTIPRLAVFINQKPVFSDSLKVEVNPVKVDTLKQKMYDIKDIIEVDNDYSNLKKYFFGFLMLFSLGFLIYELIMMRKNRKPEVIVFKTPIEKATALINQLDAKQLFQKGEIKEYYSELTDIARNYIEEEINVPAMESTTSELIYALQKASKHKKLRLSKETLKNLEKVLKQADLVKFAKSKPQENQITDDRNRILDSIVTIHKSIPIVKPEENNSELNKIELEKLAKAKKSKKIKTAVIVAISILIISIVTLTFTKGFTYLKDTVFGSQTKELFEGEWIYSQYGNPAIKIETPQVLKRTDVSAALPKESSALIKEMQTFVSGSLVGNFYVSVSTLKMKEKTEVDLNAALDSSISFMEAQGAQNILVKPEDFSTPNGMKGIRGQGTLMLINPLTKGKTKMQYQTLIFNQENGLQQVVIMFEDKDEYGEKIAERVFNSVELQQKTQ